MSAPSPEVVATRPLVSVIIPCFKQAHFLAEAIESALAQTYAPVEIVVVDDGSPDDTAGVARQYPTVRYVRRPNGGLPAARNTGVANSAGELLIFLDSDDVLLPHAVATGVRELAEHPECGFTAGWCRPFVSPRELLDPYVWEPPNPDSLARLLRNNGGVLPVACMYRRAAFEEVGGYDESFRSLEDWDLNLRMGRRRPAAFHFETVGLYRRHGDSMSTNAERMLVALAAMLRRERPLVRGHPAHEAALAHGRHWMGTLFGEQILERARLHARARRWTALARDLRILAEHYPAGLGSIVSGKLNVMRRRVRRLVSRTATAG